jgi:hypothetical protein
MRNQDRFGRNSRDMIQIKALGLLRLQTGS